MKIIIIGAGGFAREVYQWITDKYSPDAVKGFLSPNKDDLKGFLPEKHIIGTEDSYQFTSEDRCVLAIGSPKLRKVISHKVISRGGLFMNYTHPTAIVSPRAKLGEGVVICPFSLVSPNAVIGNFSVLNFYCSVAHDAVIGNFTVMSPYSTLNGFAETGEGVFLGTRVSIAPSVKIGSWSKLSAGLALTKDVEEFAFAPPTEVKIMKGLAKLF